jgi:hypothetical protein
MIFQERHKKQEEKKGEEAIHRCLENIIQERVNTRSRETKENNKNSKDLHRRTSVSNKKTIRSFLILLYLSLSHTNAQDRLLWVSERKV